MADYWGMNAIAAQMGVNASTLHRWHRQHSFLMYKRRRAPGKQMTWYTNDALIHTWEVSRCRTDWQKALDETARRQQQLRNQAVVVDSQTSKENTPLRTTQQAS